jgi:hypothetical protein
VRLPQKKKRAQPRIDTARTTAMRPSVDIEFALKAVIGTASPVLGVITSFREHRHLGRAEPHDGGGFAFALALGLAAGLRGGGG